MTFWSTPPNSFEEWTMTRYHRSFAVGGLPSACLLTFLPDVPDIARPPSWCPAQSGALPALQSLTRGGGGGGGRKSKNGTKRLDGAEDQWGGSPAARKARSRGLRPAAANA